MSKRFFNLASPGDMLSKAEREFERLNGLLNVDNAFNFFVTAYHVKDYVLTLQPSLKTDVHALFAEPDMHMCDFMCNKGKHMELTQRPKVQPDKDAELRGFSGAFGGAPFGTRAWNAGGPMHFVVDGKPVEVIPLAERVLQRWREFFDLHNIAR